VKKISNKEKIFRQRQESLKIKLQSRISGVSRNKKRKKILQDKMKSKPIVIQAPAVFNLANNETRHELLTIINKASSYLTNGKRIRVCFKKTKQLQPCGTLYFVSNIESLLEKYPGKIDCNYPEDDIVEQLFQHIGLIEKLGKPPRKIITADNVINWHFASGTDATTNAFQQLLLQHQEAMGGEVTRSSLYDCMSEAVTNTRKHAYPPSYISTAKRWWMFSQAKNHQLEVAICDLGIGIPDSLKEKRELVDYVIGLRSTFTTSKTERIHSEMIKLAVLSNRSRTGLAYRGKGLPQMLDFIKNGDTGGFRVQSGYGFFQYAAKTKTEVTQHRKHKIRGTLVQWTLPLSN
jgi:hypothetical protein